MVPEPSRLNGQFWFTTLWWHSQDHTSAPLPMTRPQTSLQFIDLSCYQLSSPPISDQIWSDLPKSNPTRFDLARLPATPRWLFIHSHDLPHLCRTRGPNGHVSNSVTSLTWSGSPFKCQAQPIVILDLTLDRAAIAEVPCFSLYQHRRWSSADELSHLAISSSRPYSL